MRLKTTLSVFVVCLIAFCCAPAIYAADEKPVTIENWKDHPDDWFNGDEGKQIVSNIISWQNANGGWYKSYDTRQPRPAEYKPADHPLAPADDRGDTWAKVSTIDNDATYTELRVLARAVRATGREDAREAFSKGLQFLFEAQYPNGGWPQRFPLQKNYGRHVTLNDGALAGVMTLMRDASQGAGDFQFVDESIRAKATESFARAVRFLVMAQIKLDGRLTAWGQQHDAETLAPTGARTYELPSICTTESALVLKVLMEIENPDDDVKNTVNSAVQWFEAVKMTGKRYDKFAGPEFERGFERRLVDDPAAPPYWARFYDLKTQRPLFVDRDGSIHETVDTLSYDRRAGYAWFSTSPNSVLKAYPKWKARVGA